MMAIRFLTLLLINSAALIIFLQQPTPQYTIDDTFILGTQWSHSGDMIAAVGVRPADSRSIVRVANVTTGQTVYEDTQSFGGPLTVSWSPNDRFLAIGGYDATIRVLDLHSETIVATLLGHQSTVTHVDWSPDGTRLVSSGNWDQLVILWDMLSYQPLETVDVGDVWTAVFSPDGDQIAVGTTRGLLLLPAAMQVGGPLEQGQYLSITDTTPTAISWNSTGERLVIGTQSILRRGAEIIIVDAVAMTSLIRFPTHEEAIYGMDWTRDEQRVFTYSTDGNVNVWDVGSQTLINTYIGTNVYPASLDLSPFEGRLAYGLIIPPENIDDIRAFGSNGFDGLGVEIVVPDPSLERLQSIAESCGAAQLIGETVTDAALSTVITQLEAATAEQIPPACAADLIAIAEAIQNQ